MKNIVLFLAIFLLGCSKNEKLFENPDENEVDSAVDYSPEGDIEKDIVMN